MHDSNERLLSYGSIDLLQSGFTKRAWYNLPKDTYKGNGRLRHESLNIHLGPLLNIQMHSYQSDQVGKTKLFGVGGEEHMDVYIFRNNDIIGGKPFEIIKFGENINKKYSKEDSTYLGHNELARKNIFKQFLANEESSITLDRQLITNQLISDFYIATITKQSVNNIIK